VIRRSQTAEAGVTLIETLVVVLLLGFMATIILAGTRLGSQVWSRVERQTTETADMDTLRGLLHRTIAAAYPAFTSTDINDQSVAFDGTPDELSFVAPEPGSNGNGEWAVLRLHLDDQGASKALYLSWRLDLPSSDDSVPLPSRRVLLLDHVANLRFAYFGSTDTEEAQAWHDDWVDRDHLPAFVRIRLARDNPRLSSWPELLVRPRVTTNVACAYDAVDALCHRVP
jgi:general secretion pathway protein J